MAIVGVTVSKTGELIQRLPVATKLAIGLAPSGEKRWPERLDHFILMRRGPEKGSWVPDQELMAHYAPKCKHDISDSCEHCCREIKILLLDDDVSNVFPHELAWYGKTGKKCWGDGEKAMRRKDDVSDAVPWTPCRNAVCPDWEAGRCAGSGDLRFCLADFPVLGSISRIHTTSLRSVENIASALNLIQSFTGGRLAGVTVPLCVTMTNTTYLDEGKRKSTTVPILSIHSEVNALVESIKATMQLWGTARKAFGKNFVIDDDEAERAVELPPEFPAKAEQKALPEATARPETKPPETKKAEAEPPKLEAEKSAKPKVEKQKMTYEGVPKSLREEIGTAGKWKGKPFWHLVLEGAGGDINLIVKSAEVKEKVQVAIDRHAHVKLPCEVIVGQAAQAVIVEDVVFPPPETPTDTPPWMLE